MKKEKRIRIGLSANKDEFKLIEEKANFAKLPVSTYVKSIVLKAIEE